MNPDFRPTWLMIKQHRVTGLKYFCKTTGKNPMTYKGSGVYWKRHLREHGKHGDLVQTLWCQYFTDRDEIVAYATKFSIENDIIAGKNPDGSKIWANLIIETGVDDLDGNGMPDEQRLKLADTWEVRHPDGTVEEVENMLEFCRTHKLNPSTMSAVARGKRSQHHGFYCKKLSSNRVNGRYEHKEYVPIPFKMPEDAKVPRGSTHIHSIPVRINGVDYPCVSDAMKATGLTRRKVKQMTEVKHELTQFQEMASVRTSKNPAGGKRRQPVHIHGVDYESISEAMRLTGFTWEKIKKLTKGKTNEATTTV